MELIDERWCPVARCDACHERITSPEEAGVVWGEPGYKATSPAPIMILCKTRGCLGRGPGLHRLWNGLGPWLVFLLDNTGMTRQQWARAQRLAKSMQRV